MKIANEAEYELTIEKIETLWESQEGTPEHHLLTHLIKLVHEYEDQGADELLVG